MNMKKFTAIFLLTALLLSLLAGCGENAADPTDGKTEPQVTEQTYTASFVDQQGNPVANVVVMWTLKDGSIQLAITAADGELSVVATDAPSITVSSLPSGYTAEKTEYSFSGTDLTVVLTSENPDSGLVQYTITVVDQDGNPVSGAIVQICDEENCKLPMTTDENGKASAEYAQSEYHVTLNTLPEGYSSQETVFYFEGATELTIVVAAANEG